MKSRIVSVLLLLSSLLSLHAQNDNKDFVKLSDRQIVIPDKDGTVSVEFDRISIDGSKNVIASIEPKAGGTMLSQSTLNLMFYYLGSEDAVLVGNKEVTSKGQPRLFVADRLVRISPTMKIGLQATGLEKDKEYRITLTFIAEQVKK